MRNIFYCFLLAFFILGCRKEDSLEVQLELRDLYAITDNPNDSIQHRIWEIYDKYHVPVYFNDTIAKEFMKIDVYGDTVWRYETVDMAWTFDGNEGRTYTYSYMTDPKEQMFALDIVEKLLTDASPTLYPYSIFIADSALAVNDNGRTSWNGGAYSVGYKTLLMTGNWEDDPANVSWDNTNNRLIVSAAGISPIYVSGEKLRENQFPDATNEYMKQQQSLNLDGNKVLKPKITGDPLGIIPEIGW